MPTNTLFSEVAAGKPYAVQVIGGAFRGEAFVVTTPEELIATTLKVRAGKHGALGKLTVLPKRRGREFRASHGSNIELWVADFESGLPLVSGVGRKNAPTEFTLPEGKYRVVLEGQPNVGSSHGILFNPRMYGRAEAIVEIKSGGEHTVALDLQPGGYINISVQGESNADDLESLHKQFPGNPAGTDWLVEYGRTTRIQIRRKHFLTEHVMFSGFSMEGSSAAGTHLQRAWPFGEQHRSQMLPTGTYELLVTTHGGRQIVKTVEIKEGRTLELALEFPKE